MLAADGVQVTAPAAFKRAQAPVIPGLEFTEPLAAGAGANGFVAGVLPDAAGPSLLPERFVSGLGTPPATDDRVSLGGHEAVRYRDLRPNGFDRPLTVYVVPLREGAAAVACYGAQEGCDQTAASLKLEGHEALPVGPDPGARRGSRSARRRPPLRPRRRRRRHSPRPGPGAPRPTR